MSASRLDQIREWRAQRLTMEECGARLGISRVRVGQLCKKHGIKPGPLVERRLRPRVNGKRIDLLVLPHVDAAKAEQITETKKRFWRSA